MDENVKSFCRGFTDAFNTIEAKDPHLKKEIADWKNRMETFALSISNPADFYPKFMDSGLNEEYTTLISKLYMQDCNTAAPTNDTPQETPKISVRDFVEQYRTAYDEVRKAGYRKRTEKAYETIFAVADRTDDMLEAQIILEHERLLWKIVSEDLLDIFEPIVEATDPLMSAVYLPQKRYYDTYRACNCDEELTYHGQRLERQIAIIKQREAMHIFFAAKIVALAGEAAGNRNAFWGFYLRKDTEKAKKAAAKSLAARDKCRHIIALLKQSLNIDYKEFAVDKHLHSYRLAAQNLVELGRYKKALPPAQLEYYNEVIDEQIIPDLSDSEFLMHETRAVYYKMYDDSGYDANIRRIAEENSNKMTYYKYRETFKKSIN